MCVWCVDLSFVRWWLMALHRVSWTMLLWWVSLLQLYTRSKVNRWHWIFGCDNDRDTVARNPNSDVICPTTGAWWRSWGLHCEDVEVVDLWDWSEENWIGEMNLKHWTKIHLLLVLVKCLMSCSPYWLFCDRPHQSSSPARLGIWAAVILLFRNIMSYC